MLKHVLSALITSQSLHMNMDSLVCSTAQTHTKKPGGSPAPGPLCTKVWFVHTHLFFLLAERLGRIV